MRSPVTVPGDARAGVESGVAAYVEAQAEDVDEDGHRWWSAMASTASGKRQTINATVYVAAIGFAATLIGTLLTARSQR